MLWLYYRSVRKWHGWKICDSPQSEDIARMNRHGIGLHYQSFAHGTAIPARMNCRGLSFTGTALRKSRWVGWSSATTQAGAPLSQDERFPDTEPVMLTLRRASRGTLYSRKVFSPTMLNLLSQRATEDPLRGLVAKAYSHKFVCPSPSASAFHWLVGAFRFGSISPKVLYRHECGVNRSTGLAASVSPIEL